MPPHSCAPADSHTSSSLGTAPAPPDCTPYAALPPSAPQDRGHTPSQRAPPHHSADVQSPRRPPRADRQRSAATRAGDPLPWRASRVPASGGRTQATPLPATPPRSAGSPAAPAMPSAPVPTSAASHRARWQTHDTPDTRSGARADAPPLSPCSTDRHSPP